MTKPTTFTEWISFELQALNLTKLQMSKDTGIPARTLSQSNHCKPHIDNMVIICEYINQQQNGNENDFDKLIIDAISKCCIHYQFAIQKINQKVTS